jgi:glutamate-1-semialdehyde 2,1-aminomutase
MASTSSQDLVERAIRALPGGTIGNVPMSKDHPVIIREGRGSKVYDVDGREYLDYMIGSGPMILGHAHPAVVEAVQRQMARGSTFFITNELAIELAEEIVRAVPCAEQVRYVSSGTEATFYALRIARAYRKRDKILKFEGGYHGMHDYAIMSLSPTKLSPFPTPVANSAGVPKAVQDTVLVAPFNDLDYATELIEQNHDDLAAVIVEPLQRVIEPMPGFLQGLRKVTQQYEIPLIFDEIVTGFRFAYGGAQEYYGVEPDIAAIGKIVGGGFPLAGVVGKRDIMHSFDPEMEGTDEYVPQVGTLNGNPIAAAAGLATLEVLRQPGAYERLFATGRQLMGGLEQLLREAEIPAKVSGEAPMFDVYFTEEEIVDYRATMRADSTMHKKFVSSLVDQGILRAGHKFYVSLAHDQQDVDRTLDAFKQAIDIIR